MAGPFSPSELPHRASPQFLREPEIRRGIELLYFGYSHLTRSADVVLDRHGLGRAHHRALYFIARQPGLTVGELLRRLAITKQSLGRVLNDLTDRALVGTASGELDRRQKLLRLRLGRWVPASRVRGPAYLPGLRTVTLHWPLRRRCRPRSPQRALKAKAG